MEPLSYQMCIRDRDVDAAGLVDGGVVAGALGGPVTGVAVRHAGVGGVDVDVVKELLALSLIHI